MVMMRLRDHLNEALKYFSYDRVVGLFLQGSQNYGLQLNTANYNSDVDSKLVVVPSFEEVVFNKKPTSTTHVMTDGTDEHVDFKDVRLMFECFRKQNINFLEVLFSKYTYMNNTYTPYWNNLVKDRELLAHANPYQAVKTMAGTCKEKYHAMERRYESRAKWLDEFGYDPKTLHHLVRVCEFLERYLNDESYENCLRPRDPEWLKSLKVGALDLAAARTLADDTLAKVKSLEDSFCSTHSSCFNPLADTLLNDTLYSLMKTALKGEFAGLME